LAIASTEPDAGRLAGSVYAANTLGAIGGSVVTSFILVPWIGSSHATQALVIVSALSALLMLEPSYTGATEGAPRFRLGGTLVLGVAMVAAGLLARSVKPLP